jgi:septum formation protein
MVGFDPVVRVAAIPEVRGAAEEPEDYVLRLAEEKAKAVEAAEDEVILAADTTVVVRSGSETAVLEKPEDAADAERMLRLLSGRRHEVLTAFAVRFDAHCQTHLERSYVEFFALTEEEIADYLAAGEWQDKAGGYAIQGRAARYIRGVEGCYQNVVGLPVAQVYRALRELPFGIRA